LGRSSRFGDSPFLTHQLPAGAPTLQNQKSRVILDSAVNVRFGLRQGALDWRYADTLARQVASAARSLDELEIPNL